MTQEAGRCWGCCYAPQNAAGPKGVYGAPGDKPTEVPKPKPGFPGQATSQAANKDAD